MSDTTVKNTTLVKAEAGFAGYATWLSRFLMVLVVLLFGIGCSEDDNVLPQSTDSTTQDLRGNRIYAQYEKTNLVADVPGYDANLIDPNLVNAWGIAIGPSGAFWISATASHSSVIYSDEGETLRAPVTMDGDPTGQVYNGTSGFLMPDSSSSRFIFATTTGAIAAWSTGDAARTMIDNSANGAGYTGLELIIVNDRSFLLAANVRQGKIDVFDSDWNQVDYMPFQEFTSQPGKPFNVRLINGEVFVTYAGSGGMTTTGSGGNYINVFSTKGNFVRRFASAGMLNSPWGITATPAAFGLDGNILVGNFGDGRILIYNRDGVYQGMLGETTGQPIMIDGLWDLKFTEGAMNGTSDPDLYFTAGPGGEEHGLFGEIEVP